MGNPGGGAESQPTGKIYSFFQPEKSSLINLHFAPSSVIPSPSNRNNHPIQASFVAVAIAVVSFFLTSGFMYTHVILILLIIVY